MRKVVPDLLLSLGLTFLLTACVTATRWERPGGDPATLAHDHDACRAAAEQEANQLYSYGDGPPVFGVRPISFLEWRQIIDQARWQAAVELTDACMHQKGYARVPVTR